MICIGWGGRQRLCAGRSGVVNAGGCKGLGVGGWRAFPVGLGCNLLCFAGVCGFGGGWAVVGFGKVLEPFGTLWHAVERVVRFCQGVLGAGGALLEGSARGARGARLARSCWTRGAADGGSERSLRSLCGRLSSSRWRCWSRPRSLGLVSSELGSVSRCSLSLLRLARRGRLGVAARSRRRRWRAWSSCQAR